MAIAFDAVSTPAHNGGVTSLSTSHTASGTDRIVLIGVYHEATTVSSISYGAQTPTLIRDHSGADMSLYRLVAPSTGAQTITVNFAGSSTRCALFSVSYTGVDQTTPLGTDVEDIVEAGTTVDVVVTSAVGELVVDFGLFANSDITVGASQTTHGNELDDWDSVFRSAGMSDEAGAASVTMSWTTSGASDGFIIAVPIKPAAAGGTVNTQTLSDTVVIVDAGLDYVFANRLASDNVLVSEGTLDSSVIYNIEAISETTITDELLAWLRRYRVLDDSVTITDELISSIIGHLIYNSVLTSNVSVTDEALKTASFYRLADSNVITTDQLLTALLIARDLLDGVDVTDSTLTSMQRFILLTDTISLEDSLLSTYVPETTVNPLIRIGFDQPDVQLGGYSVN